MRRLVSSLLAVLILSLALPAFAQDDAEDVPLLDRFYMTIGAGQSLQQFDEDGGLDFDDAPGGGLRAGFEALPFLDTEIQYEFGGRFDDSTVDVSVDVHTLTGNLKVRPVASVAPDFAVQPYVLAGFGWLHGDLSGPGADDTEDGWAVRTGIGVEIPIDVFMSIYTEGGYVFTGGGAKGLDYAHIGAGFVVRFDSDGW